MIEAWPDDSGPSPESKPSTLSNMFGSARGGPTALRIVLGGQLRRLREAKGISAEEAAEVIRASHSKISRMELGRVGFKDRDIADLLSLYGVTDPTERSALLSLAREANKPGWWHDSADVLPSWFEPYVGLEEAASVIRTYQVQFVPGLLQTHDYARAVVQLSYPKAAGDSAERRASLRMKRQELLTRDGAPKFWAVVDEAALRRPVGGREVMRRQLAHLIEATRLPNVTLQVVPFHAGGHSGAGGSFCILRFAEPDLPDVVYLEQLTSALYLDRPAHVDHYQAVIERLCIEAEPASKTETVLEKILSDT